MKNIIVGKNDLETTHPEIAKEAFGWNPTGVMAGNNKKFSWKCQKSHIYQASINHRTAKKNPTKCPYCTNQKPIVGENDLATTHPAIAAEAYEWDPRTVTSGSGKKKQWKCENQHVWSADTRHRVRGNNCPYCASYGFNNSDKGWVYFLVQNDWKLFQIGITNHPSKRIESHKNNGWKVLEIRGPMEGYIAREIENSILRFLKNQGAMLSPIDVIGKFDGYTESWTIDSYKVNNLKELIDKATEAGF